MRMQFLLMLLFPITIFSQTFSTKDINRYKTEAQQVNIIRDIYGVPHIYGKTDATTVFGLMYAQCEENFPRIERNYLEMMGRLSEQEGKTQLLNDLEMRLIYDSAAAKNDYAHCEPWFRKLLDAFADGINFYLYKHPEVHPSVLKKFEPWFPLMYTDGSIAPTQDGGITLKDISELYDKSVPTSFHKPVFSF